MQIVCPFQVPEDMEISQLASTVLQGYPRSGYAGEGTFLGLDHCTSSS